MAQYKAKIANTIEELNELIDNRWTVISIKGEAFNLLSDKVREIAKLKNKNKTFNKGAKIFTGIAGIASLFVPGVNLTILALAAVAAGNGAVGLSSNPLSLLSKKEYRKYIDYNVEKIDEDVHEIVLLNSRYKTNRDTYIYEKPASTLGRGLGLLSEL